MIGQMDTFDFLQDDKFNPLEALALEGTGYGIGTKRVFEFFSCHHTVHDKVKFLKREFGMSGFSHGIRKPHRIHSMMTNSQGILYSYYDENNDFHEESITFEKLSFVITDMIAKGKYHTGGCLCY